MFRVESCLRVCTWDPAHGKPYASAQSVSAILWGDGGWRVGERGLTVVGLDPLSTHGATETCTVSFLCVYRVIREGCCLPESFVRR